MKFTRNQKFRYTEHALLRMSQRQISKKLVEEVLYFNRISKKKRGWKYEKGGLIVIVDYKNPYKIITVYLDGEPDET